MVGDDMGREESDGTAGDNMGNNNNQGDNDSMSETEMFSMADQNNDGNITLQEMAAAANLDGNCDESCIMGLTMYFNASDSNYDGMLSANEFTVFYSVFTSSDNEQGPSMEIMFTMFDTNADGSITASEFSAFQNASDDYDNISSGDWTSFEYVFNNLYDQDGNGGLDQSEFAIIMSMDDQDDDDGNMGGDGMGGDDMLPTLPGGASTEMIEELDVANATFALSLATDTGYAFTTSVTEELLNETGVIVNVTSIIIFTFNTQFEVISVTAENSMETLAITLLSEDQVAEYFKMDVSSHKIQAIPFALNPIDHNDDFVCDNGEIVDMDWVNDGDNDCGDNSDENVNMGGDNMAAYWNCIEFVNYSLAPSDGNLSGIFMTNGLDSSMCGTPVDDTQHTFGTGESTLPNKMATRDCMIDELDLSTQCDTSVIESNSTGIWDYSYQSEESDICEGDFDSSTNMCLEFLGEISMNDSKAIEVTYQGESTTVMYQYNSTTESGILIVKEYAEDNDMGGDEMTSPLDWEVELQDLYPTMAGKLTDYSAVLSVCTDNDDSSDGSFDLTCGEDVLVVALTDANMDAEIYFHDADNSNTITVGDMFHVSPNATGNWTDLRLYSTTADAYSDENPMMTPGFTGVIGMIALLGAALLTRRD